jgi:hypothetical protein
VLDLRFIHLTIGLRSARVNKSSRGHAGTSGVGDAHE